MIQIYRTMIRYLAILLNLLQDNMIQSHKTMIRDLMVPLILVQYDSIIDDTIKSATVQSKFGS